MNRWREIVWAYWQARTQRERNILLASTFLLALLLCWLWMVLPALEGRAAWKKNLPALRVQQTQIQTLLAELKAAPSAVEKKLVPVSRQLIESSLIEKSLKPDNLSVIGEVVALKFTNTSFSSLLGWLQEIQGSAQLRVTESTISALPQADHVDVTLSLRQTR
jgi:general secretion pathway protein M